MNCEQFTDILDDYLDNALDVSLRSSADQHIAECDSCKTQLHSSRQLLEMLKDVPVPSMSPGFAQRAVRQAVIQNQHNHHHRRGFITGFGSAIAAGLLLALVVGGLLPMQQATQPMTQQVASAVTAPIPEITLSVEQVQMVNVVFDSTQAVAGAELTITLPAHVELSGYPGKHSLAWRSDIKQGRNVLSLPIRGLMEANGELVAQVNANGKIKSIRIQLQVNDKAVPHALIPQLHENLS